MTRITLPHCLLNTLGLNFKKHLAHFIRNNFIIDFKIPSSISIFKTKLFDSDILI